VLRYDLFGRGYSDRPLTDYNQDLFDRQLLELLAGLEIKQPADLVGLSLGGAIAVVFADRHPDSVRRLCLVDPAGLPWKQSLKARLVMVPLLGEWIMRILGDKVLIANIKDYFFGEQGFAEFADRFRVQMQYTGFKQAILSTIRSGITNAAADSYERLGQRELPIMLLWGRHDEVVPFALSQEIRRLIPQTEFHVIEQAAHIPHYQRPEVVNPLLIEFFSR
jgi:pimeloyl-ACP methyl ester carboxylesterase